MCENCEKLATELAEAKDELKKVLKILATEACAEINAQCHPSGSCRNHWIQKLNLKYASTEELQ